MTAEELEAYVNERFRQPARAAADHGDGDAGEALPAACWCCMHAWMCVPQRLCCKQSQACQLSAACPYVVACDGSREQRHVQRQGYACKLSATTPSLPITSCMRTCLHSQHLEHGSFPTDLPFAKAVRSSIIHASPYYGWSHLIDQPALCHAPGCMLLLFQAWWGSRGCCPSRAIPACGCWKCGLAWSASWWSACCSVPSMSPCSSSPPSARTTSLCAPPHATAVPACALACAACLWSCACACAHPGMVHVSLLGHLPSCLRRLTESRQVFCYSSLYIVMTLLCPGNWPFLTGNVLPL